MKLTIKQKLFCDEYLKDFNATQAAIRAKYSPNTAYSIGQENLKKPEIKKYIDERLKKRVERLELSQDKVLRELARIVFFDPRKLFDEDGKLKSITELDDDTAAVIAGVDITTTKINVDGDEETLSEVTKKIKYVDKKGAIELAMKHLGILTEKLDLTTQGEKIAQNVFVIPSFANPNESNSKHKKGN